VQASTYSDFSQIAASSQTGNISLSTLTVQNLAGGRRITCGGRGECGRGGELGLSGGAGGNFAWVADFGSKIWRINNLSTNPPSVSSWGWQPYRHRDHAGRQQQPGWRMPAAKPGRSSI